MPRFWEKEILLWLVYSLIAVAVSVQRYSLPLSPEGYTHYENYVIFKNAWHHLLQGANLYGPFPDEQWDLFKYSPAFAMAMAPFEYLPDYLGLPLWNLLNALVLLAAIFQLPLRDPRHRAAFAWFVLPELIISLQNSQSNGLTAGLLLWTFVAFERSRPGKAAWWVASSAFIKIFGIFAAVLGLLYPRKGAFAGWLLAWGLGLALVPVLVVGPAQLATVYGWWWDLLRSDHAASVGLSVAGWLQSWFGMEPPKVWITGAGLVIFLASVGAAWRLQGKPAALESRRLAWASLLLWVVIFNHKAESPTFVIALSGAALWYWGARRRRRWETALLVIVFVFASLSPTDLFPSWLRREVVRPYVLKAVPCIILWFWISLQLLAKGWKPVDKT